jgi:hypothetical protein
MDRERRRNVKYVLLMIFVVTFSAASGCGRLTKPANPDITGEPAKPTITPTAEAPEGTPTVTPTADIAPSPTATLEPTPTSETPAHENIGPFIPLQDEQERQQSVIQELLTGPSGDVWIVGEDNVTSYDGEKWLFHGDITGHTLGFDGLGQLWIVDRDGIWITAYDGENWVQYGAKQGWAPAGRMFNVGMYGSVSEGVVTDSRGHTWLTTTNDIRVLRDGKWFIYDPIDAGFTPTDFMLEEGFGFIFSDIAIDTNGDVWVADCAWMGPGPQGQGARWYDGEKWMGQDSQIVRSGCIKDIEVSTDGRIWAGIDDEVWRYTQGEGWENFPHPVEFPLDEDGMRWGWIIDLLLDGTDAVWMTMVPCGGASCDLGRIITFWVSEEEWLVIGDTKGEDVLPDVATGANDLTWGCFSNGLYSIAAGEFIPVVEDLPSRCQVEADKDGRVWLSLAGESTLWVFDAP